MLSNDTPQSSAVKVCKTCVESKPLSLFGKYTAGGYRTDCNDCVNRKARERRAANPEHFREIMRRSREKTSTREPVTPLTKVCPRCEVERPSADFYVYRRNRDGLDSYCKFCWKAYNAAIMKRIVKRSRDWQRNNRKRFLAIQQNWVNRDPENARVTKIVSAHKSRAKKAGAVGSFTKAEWLELCAKYDHRCVACGASEPLTVDHVVPVIKGGSSDIANIQPLCASCNHKKATQTIDYRVGRQ